ncbi:MAG: TolC family protein [Cyanobacteria bacterium P01_H01_bin.119]
MTCSTSLFYSAVLSLSAAIAWGASPGLATPQPSPISSNDAGESPLLAQTTPPGEDIINLPDFESFDDPSLEGNELPNQPAYQTGSPQPGEAPETLNNDPNPLRYPTQPEEVEIIGTQPITLQQAIELAYENSQTFRVALLQLEQSREVLREAQAALLPTVDATASITGQDSASTNIGGISVGGDFDTTLSGGVRVDYNLFTSGLRDANIQAAERQVRLNELTLEQTREELRFNTTSDYYDLQEVDQQVRINAAFLAEAQRNLEDTQIREEVGVGTRFDVLRAEVQVANARQNLIQSQSQRRIAQRQLANRLNLPPTVDVSAVPPSLEDPWPLSLEESIVLAFQNRSELEQQLVQREIGEQQRRAALAAVRPQVSVFGNYTLQDNLSNSSGVTDNISVGAQVTWRLFDGGAAAAQAAQRDRDIDISEETFSQTRGNIRFQVEQAFSNLSANRANVRTAEIALEQAQEALELANLRFNAGVGTQLDVITAQSELTEAQSNLVSAVVGYNRALASMERAISNLPDGLTAERPLSGENEF